MASGTEWIDALEKRGIIKKDEPLEQDSDTFDIEGGFQESNQDKIVNYFDPSKNSKNTDQDTAPLSDDDDDFLDQLGEDDERAFLEYRQKRLAELKILEMKPRFGEVIEITKQDYVDQVNKAGEGIWVVVHVYRESDTLCALINNHLRQLAMKFPHTKFIKSLVQLCIPNFPESNLPAIFVYHEGELKKQILGSDSFGSSKLKQDELEWIISETGAIKTDLDSDPRKKSFKARKHYTCLGVDRDSDSD
ncbi:phosducin-like protein 3 [Panonychus citri]|uniref:phosducin-like protein 3 n=1 Tax=Panonychus citri TaxID=50023 RepID=UPI0023073297|nr:phosducin-like protein 3 [Panonychus citri]